MRILIIGGTRFMGPYIIQNLRAAGHDVCAFHRGQTSATLPEGVTEIQGDRDRLPEYASILREYAPDIVLDMVVWHEQHARDLVETFAGVARRVVMVSSIDVYRAFQRADPREVGELEHVPFTEDAPLRQKLYPYRGAQPRAKDDPERWRDDYDKIPAERVVLNHLTLPGTVLRLPAVYGPRDYQHRLFLYLKRMLDKRPAILLQEDVAAWRWQHGYVEDVCNAITLAATSERASGRIYNVGESSVLSMVERVELIARTVGWQGRIVTLPGERIPKGARWEINAAQHVIADTSRIREELGYHERFDMEETFRRTVAWERDNPPAQIDASTFDYAAEDTALAEL